jgi:hypothetical protein
MAKRSPLVLSVLFDPGAPISVFTGKPSSLIRRSRSKETT